MSFLKKIFTVVTLLSLGGCASMFNGSTQLMTLSTTNGKSVKAMISNAGNTYYSTLPDSITATHDVNSISVFVSDKNYESTEYRVPKSITPAFWANILFWPGFFVDMATGDMWKYPSDVIVPLTAKKA